MVAKDMNTKKIFTRCMDLTNPWDFDVYRNQQGGYKSVSKALAMTPDQIIEEVKKSNLRGRGGAGFPTGMKWGFLPKVSNKPKYLVINADEGEPGTFKDRLILEYDPHRLIEGCIVSCHALGANTCYIFIRGEMVAGIQRVEEAVKQAYAKGFLGKSVAGSKFSLDIHVHRGAGAYICGEETALLEALEGKAGQPRMKPPFPAVVGLFGCPTIINNVETIAAIPTIINDGGALFASEGFIPSSPEPINGVRVNPSGGIKMYCVSGHVVRPGVFEAPHGIPMSELIYGEQFSGGMRNGKQLKAVIPGGSSCPMLLPHQLDIPMDFDSLKTVGSLFGTGGVVVMDEDTCMVRVAANLAHFYHGESCGQCTPCREGTGWLVRIIDNIEAGRGTREDVDLLLDVCDNIEGNTICPHGDAAAMAVRSYLKNFAQEFYDHVEKGCCPFKPWHLPGEQKHNHH